jgi:uncharacterized protein
MLTQTWIVHSNCLQNKIALGTVQLGVRYGINNTVGMPDEQGAFDILEAAAKSGITLIDSADAYGDSLLRIARFVSSHKGNTFDLVNKFISNNTSVVDGVDQLLHLSGLRQIYSMMYHRFDDYSHNNNRDELLKLKADRKIQKIGVSVYEESGLEKAVADPIIDLIQVPFHPLDASKRKKQILEEAKRLNKEIHVRSVFLQGLFFKAPESLTGNLRSLAPSLRQFNKIIENSGWSARQALLNYAIHQPFIDKVVIGVDTPEQLSQNLHSIVDVIDSSLFNELENISVPDKALLNPSNWKP